MNATNGVKKCTRISLLRQRLMAQPNDSQVLYQLGAIYSDQNQIDAAVGFFCQAVAAEQQNPVFYSALGAALNRSGRSLEAVCAFRQALALDNDLASAYDGLGMALRSGGDLELAIACMQTAVRKAPQSAEYWTNLAATLGEKRDYANAYKAAKKGKSLDPTSRGGCIYFIESLFGKGRINAASVWIRRLIRDHPHWSEGFHNMGRALEAQNCLDSAIGYYRKAISIAANHADAHFGVATCLLASGNFSEGWNEYEWRFKLGTFQRSPVARFLQELTEPMWSGEDLDGKTLLVYGEQGFGDTVQFIRYVPELAKRGCRVIVMVYPEIAALLGAMRSISLVVPFFGLIPRYDYHIALCSLPRILRTTIETVPHAVPYIPAPNHRGATAQLRKIAKFRVGFVWSTTRLGALDYRNIELHYFEPLFELRSVRFYSLQVSERAEELNTYARYPNVHNLKPFIKDFRDTAYFISKMDLIISIDTSTAHLAGALGVPVWVMLPNPAEWRWLSGNNDSPWFDRSPWYPTMRLFRAQSVDSWREVIKSIQKELLKVVS